MRQPSQQSVRFTETMGKLRDQMHRSGKLLTASKPGDGGIGAVCDARTALFDSLDAALAQFTKDLDGIEDAQLSDEGGAS